jgi:di/tricarboxylate transporter
MKFSLNAETVKAVVTVLILLGAVYSFIREKVSPDVTSLLAILALLLTGILTPDEAFSGFSHSATVSVAAVLVLSAAIERSGALAVVARRLLAPLGKSELLLTIVLMVVIATISAFINNTAAVAIFIPVVLEVCRRTGASPGRVLMPMSHAATIGGMCTLVGTSTNLVAHEFALQQGLPGFSMFELGKIGLPMVLVGFSYMLFIGRLFLPHNRQGAADPFESDKRYLVEIIIQNDSGWIGKEVSATTLERDLDLELLGISRGGVSLDPSEPGLAYQSQDSLRVRGALEQVLKLAAENGLELHRPENRSLALPMTVETRPEEVAFDNEPNGASRAKRDAETEEMKLLLVEVVVLTTSGLIGQTLKDVRFADRYNAIVLALRRRGALNERPSTTPLRAGDVLVVEGEQEALQKLGETPGFVIISKLERPEQRPSSLLITLITVIAVVTTVALGLLPIVTAATAGCVTLMLTRCLRPREAYKAIDLSLVFLLAGSLALGIALEKTGLTALLAKGLAGMTGITGPYLVLIGFFVVSVVISELMSNSGTVALLGPLALSAAEQIGINPISLLVAVTFGASAAFAMPIGYQTSLMIYGPGGYRFRDFVIMGIALDLLLAALSLWLIPIYWPLYPQ